MYCGESVDQKSNTIPRHELPVEVSQAQKNSNTIPAHIEIMEQQQSSKKLHYNENKIDTLDNAAYGIDSSRSARKIEHSFQDENIEKLITQLTEDTVEDIKEMVQTISTREAQKTANVLVTALEKSNNVHSSEESNNYEIFYNKECINWQCTNSHKQFVIATSSILNYFNVNKKKFKRQYVCMNCLDIAMDSYEKSCGILETHLPLILYNVCNERNDCVEIESSDEEDNNQTTSNEDVKKPDFTTQNLEFINDELNNVIRDVLNKIDIQKQLSWTKSIFKQRLKTLKAEIEATDAVMDEAQEIADGMFNSLYRISKMDFKSLPPYELDDSQHPIDIQLQIPPTGELNRPPIQINENYYAVKNKAIASWVPCKVMEQLESTASGNALVKNFKIRYLNASNPMMKVVSEKHIAYYDPPTVRLTIGTRVIAFFDASTLTRGKEKVLAQSAFYPGIIAEPIKQANRFRYLIFYDDGYTQYVQHKDVRLVCQASEKVWEDVHPASREFIQKYVEQYSVNRPMVQTQKGQSMNTEHNGTWYYARVIDTDCSLILMQFEGAKNHTEWIYRGSLRLGPVFKEYQKNANAPQSRFSRRTEPFIRYTKDMEASNAQDKKHQQQQKHNQQQQQQQRRCTARKSSNRLDSVNQQNASSVPAPTVRHLNNSTIYVEDENRPKGKVIYYTAKRNLPPRIYSNHNCYPGCLFKMVHSLDAYSPLAKPLLSGWERMILKQKIKKHVVYRAPCGIVLRNIEEIHWYLRVTKSVLNVENFDFYPDLNCLAEYVIDSFIIQRRDISDGQEKIVIPLVNYYDNSLPPEIIYSAQRIPTEGVHLNLDKEFLVGCDCEDDCADKTKCACWKLTIEGVKATNSHKPIDEIGYQYKRLIEHVPTGIFECNSRCKCKKNCLNRVVQHSLEMKLQVFKTSNRGWGLRCINDIPKGAFICIYAGHLLTETKANEGGADAGDEYFADLDYIEVAEQLKEGYESDAEPTSEHEEDDAYLPDEDDEFRPSKSYLKRSKNKSSRSNTRDYNAQESQERQVISFNPNTTNIDSNNRHTSVRALFGKDEAPYIMDAKTTGNLGRYFNHSCNPNLFVQNVFVDTHDLRFPWVAFFACNHIRAGSELTWNYNYEVGVVPGKVLYCQCGASNCRVRLL